MSKLKISIFSGLTILLVAALVKSYADGSRNYGGILRPEVDEKINQLFPPELKLQRSAAKQLAAVFQMAIDRPDDALNILPKYLKAKACLKAFEEPGIVTKPPLSTQIESIVVDNWARSRAYVKYNAQLSGQVIDSIKPDLSACEFDTSNADN